MSTLKKILTVGFGLIMIGAGLVHFLKPEMYLPFFPAFFPGRAIVYVSGLIEMGIGVCALLPRFRRIGTGGILVLMLLYLPLHILDVFQEHPVIGSPQVALIRLPLQFVFIAWAWFINKR